MAQIKSYNGSLLLGELLVRFRRRAVAGIKWWAEHQAWPATDEIRIDPPAPGA